MRMNADIEPEKAATGPTRTYSLGDNVESFRTLSLWFTHFSPTLLDHFLWLLHLTFWNKTSYVDSLLTLELLNVFLFTAWTAYRLKHDDVPTFLHFSACMLLLDTAILDVLSWVAPKLLPTTPVLSQVLQTGGELFFLTCLSVHATAVKPGPVLCSWNILLTVLRQRLGGLTRRVSQTYVDIQSEVQAARSLMDGGDNSDKGQYHNLRESLYAEAEFDHPLGFGEYYCVNAMIVRRLDKRFARKSLRKCVRELHGTIRDKVVAGLRSEAAILKLIKKQPHHHLPIMQGAYLDGEDIYIDISPVGNSDLKKFVDEFNTSEQLLDLKKQLVRGFSCLASQLEHLHKRLNIFHGDIRLRNVIMVQGMMALIDYSMSVDLSDALEISGRALFLSRATCAPECLSSSPRGFPADIFSLGVVFTYMLTILCDKSLKTLEKGKNKKHRNQEFGSPNNIKWVREEWLPFLKYEPLSSLCSRGDFEHLKRLTHQMLDEKPEKRPDASAIRFGPSIQAPCCPRLYQTGSEPLPAVPTAVMQTDITRSQTKDVDQHPNIVPHQTETIHNASPSTSDVSEAPTSEFPGSEGTTLVTTNVGYHSPLSPKGNQRSPSVQRNPSPIPPRLAFTMDQFEDYKVGVGVKKADAMVPSPAEAMDPRPRCRNAPTPPSPTHASAPSDGPYVPGNGSKWFDGSFQNEIQQTLSNFYNSGINNVTATFPGIKTALGKETYDLQASPVSKRKSIHLPPAVVGNDTDAFPTCPPRRQRTMS